MKIEHSYIVGLNMRNLLLICLILFPVLCFAESTSSKNDRALGVTASVSSSSSSVGFELHPISGVLLTSEFGTDLWINWITPNKNSIKKSYPGNWFYGSIGFYLEGSSSDNLVIGSGVSGFYQIEPLHDIDSSGTKETKSGYGVSVNLRPKYLFSSSFGIFTTVGLGFTSSIDENQTTGYKTESVDIKLSTTGAGFVFLF